MLKELKYGKLLLFFLGVVCFSQPIYAQRAGTTVERNEEADQINELYKRGKWEEGKKIAEETLRKNPKDSEMRMLLGKYYVHFKSYDRARYELVKSLEYAPANVESKHMLVTVETETQRHSSAICYINELLEVNPYWKGLWRKKIELYRTMGNQVEADRLLKRISQIYPEDNELKKDQVYAVQQRASEIKKSGRIDQTIELARKQVDEQPRQPASYHSVIDNYIKVGDYGNALIYSERALNQFPGNETFVQKKIAILESQKRYPEILSFMDGQMKKAGGVKLRAQYNYFLLEAARSAKNNESATLYGKIFEGSAGNKEAFEHVFNDLIAKEQYEGALYALNRHRKNVGASKALDMRELTVYKRMGDSNKISSLTKEFFNKYPNDSDLRTSYVAITLQTAKENAQEGRISMAIIDWKEVIKYGDDESIRLAQHGIYNAYLAGNRYQEAIIALDDMLLDHPGNIDLLLKKADLYYKLNRYEYALTVYEQVLAAAPKQDRERHIVGYGEFISPAIKKLREEYKFIEARKLVERWLAVDNKSQSALLYMINICYQLKDHDAMLRYAKIANEYYSDELTFKIKLAEAMNKQPETLSASWALLHDQVQLNPLHEPLLNTFSHTTEEYAGKLLKNKEHKTALAIIDTALHYKENNRTLKYFKGLAYEGLKKFDSAYYYQRFYDPTLLEFEDFKRHLNYLGQKSFRNQITISHLRARFGDDYTISTISTLEYLRMKNNSSSYAGRINYAGRAIGKGIQAQLEWSNKWTERLNSSIDIALANRFFAQYALNITTIYEWKPTWKAEVGGGFRKFFAGDNLLNFNIGLGKEIEDFQLSAKLSNLLLTGRGQNRHLYSLYARAQYNMDNPKNYILAVGSIGNSPDIDLVNSQLYDSFNVFNAMVGAGISRSITKNIGASAMGTWYNFQTDRSMNVAEYRNLYNLYLQLHVSF